MDDARQQSDEGWLRGQVMIVDDELEIRNMLSRYLRACGYQPVLAGDGLQALEQLSRTPVEVVLTDLTMPRMDGLTLLEEIRKHYPSTRVLIMTGRLNEEAVGRAERSGADGCLLKPLVDLTLLEHAVERSMSLRAAWQMVQAEIRNRLLQLGPRRTLPAAQPSSTPATTPEARDGERNTGS